MAEQPNKTGLDKPAGAGAPAGEETAIHVIPEKFYGAALKQKVKKKPAPPPAQPAAGTPPPGQQPPPKKKGKTGLIVAVIVVLLLLVGGGAAVYFLFFAKKAPPKPVCGDNVCAAPAETSANCPADCGPPPAVCGDGKCDASESSFTCPKDCGAPPPVCGDKKCEGSETPQTCPVDCGPPPPVCGDGTCDKTESYTTCPADCPKPAPTVAKDTDSDGLTDIEEQQIYGTNINSADSDGDSFVDLNEVLNLFDPAKPNPAKLIDNPGITLYRNVDFGFDIYRPTKWTVSEDNTARSATFTAPTGETISVTVKDNAAGTALADWVVQNGGMTAADVTVTKTKQGYDEVFSKDRMTAYVAKDGKVFVMVYDLGDQLLIRYRVTFAMMANSLTALPPQTSSKP